MEGVEDDNLARAVDIDAVGRHHERKRLMRFRRYVGMRNTRIGTYGPRTALTAP